MNRNLMLKEAEQQKKALVQLSKWMRNAMLLSSCFFAVTFWGLTGTGLRFVFGVIGILLTITGASCAAIIGLGIRNGRRNVDHILTALERKNKRRTPDVQ